MDKGSRKVDIILRACLKSWFFTKSYKRDTCIIVTPKFAASNLDIKSIHVLTTFTLDVENDFVIIEAT